MGDQYLCVCTVENQKNFRFAYGMMLPSRPVSDVPAIDYAYPPNAVYPQRGLYDIYFAYGRIKKW